MQPIELSNLRTERDAAHAEVAELSRKLDTVTRDVLEAMLLLLESVREVASELELEPGSADAEAEAEAEAEARA